MKTIRTRSGVIAIHPRQDSDGELQVSFVSGSLPIEVDGAYCTLRWINKDDARAMSSHIIDVFNLNGEGTPVYRWNSLCNELEKRIPTDTMSSEGPESTWLGVLDGMVSYFNAIEPTEEELQTIFKEVWQKSGIEKVSISLKSIAEFKNNVQEYEKPVAFTPSGAGIYESDGLQ